MALMDVEVSEARINELEAGNGTILRNSMLEISVLLRRQELSVVCGGEAIRDREAKRQGRIF